MDEFDAKVRGERARQILHDDVFAAAIEGLQRSIVLDLTTLDVTDERAPQIALLHTIRLQTLSSVLNEITSIMTTGESAALTG
jgi:hypothetical protein